MFARLHVHGVAVLNSLSHHLSNAFDFAAFHDVATLTSLPHLFIKLHSLLRVKSTTQHTRNTPNTLCFCKVS